MLIALALIVVSSHACFIDMLDDGCEMANTSKARGGARGAATVDASDDLLEATRTYTRRVATFAALRLGRCERVVQFGTLSRRIARA